MSPWVVVGGGYWGAAAARALRARGLEVVILDSQESGAASKAAAGLVRSIPDFVRPTWWEPNHEAACHSFWQGDDFSLYPESLFNYQQLEPEFKRDVYCLRPQSEIANPQVVNQKVVSLQADGSGWKVQTETDSLAAAGVVLTAGIWTDPILEASGLPSLHIASWPGRGSIHPGPVAQSSVLTWAYRLDGDTRTRRVSAIPWQQSSNIYINEGPAEALVQKLQLGAAQKQLFGFRPRLRRWEVVESAPGLIVASGGNRSGLAGAAGIGLRVAELATTT